MYPRDVQVPVDQAAEQHLLHPLVPEHDLRDYLHRFLLHDESLQPFFHAHLGVDFARVLNAINIGFEVLLTAWQHVVLLERADSRRPLRVFFHRVYQVLVHVAQSDFVPVLNRRFGFGP